MKIAVLYGGISKEREVSLSSGKGIMNALKGNGHEVVGIDFHTERLDELINLDADCVFIGLHGKFGEDGRVQSLLEMLNIPYVGSGVLASALAMDKTKAKQIFQMNHIPVAKGEAFPVNDRTDSNQLADEINSKFEPPFVIKPNREGSTLGLTIITSPNQVKDAVLLAGKSDNHILVEAFIKGKELTVAVLGKPGEEQALPIIEIVPKNEYYDYESKYAKGGSEHIIPARISDELTEQIKEYAILAHQVLNCEVYSRVDFILDSNNTPYILEVNTLPGMTPTSLFPDTAKTIGLNYNEMIETFVRLSMEK